MTRRQHACLQRLFFSQRAHYPWEENNHLEIQVHCTLWLSQVEALDKFESTDHQLMDSFLPWCMWHHIKVLVMSHFDDRHDAVTSVCMWISP